MTIIKFEPRKQGSLSAVFQRTAPVNHGPKPNFEDPHSRDFGDEPTYNKRQCSFLPYEDEQLVNRFIRQRGLHAQYGDDTIKLTSTVNFDGVKNQTIRSLFSNRPTIMDVAEINITRGEKGNSYSYRLHGNGESGLSGSFRALIGMMERHMDTGSPELPEPEFWR